MGGKVHFEGLKSKIFVMAQLRVGASSTDLLSNAANFSKSQADSGQKSSKAMTEKGIAKTRGRAFIKNILAP
ncbi:MAG: hypothetical protein ONB48_15120 [candidate division KSB1 bacterium]|nr:hypothetical protein [candidate division KSB1 bacterium]MDZ7273432.1 hypothetical protein [candidate division KSB1 bacterium]MDZ7286976.1 hypothetical protein [candidate division KSB1 bacterium]MDZ7299671.1 hypothetical protein [candidate division KSB1 bacterium]MDZ7307935.1 hypothetical protein [candidate division KSB1 bacterium]